MHAAIIIYTINNVVTIDSTRSLRTSRMDMAAAITGLSWTPANPGPGFYHSVVQRIKTKYPLENGVCETRDGNMGHTYHSLKKAEAGRTNQRANHYYLLSIPSGDCSTPTCCLLADDMFWQQRQNDIIADVWCEQKRDDSVAVSHRSNFQLNQSHSLPKGCGADSGDWPIARSWIWIWCRHPCMYALIKFLNNDNKILFSPSAT
jgi:hypothetical protein